MLTLAFTSAGNVTSISPFKELNAIGFSVFTFTKFACTCPFKACATALLGVPLPRVQRRWAGVYSEVVGSTALYHRSEVAPGVVLVTGPGGRGMTCSPAIAEETFL